MRLGLLAEAFVELEDAAVWYERERKGYGNLFMSEVGRAVERAGVLPRSGRRVPETDPDHDIRSFAVHRFPYLVITAIVDSRRVVIAVAHGHRRPMYWLNRLT